MMRTATGRRAGLTLVELVLAAGLGVMVMTGVFSLLNTSLDLWTKGEERRTQVERSGAVLELMGRDLRGLSGGTRGDLLVDWQLFDADADQSPDRAWPRMRFVRQASEAELARLYLGSLDPEQAERLREEGFLPAEGAAGLQLDPPPPTGLVEVCWAVLPAGKGEELYEGILMRGVRMVDGSLGSFLDPGFLGRSGQPPAGSLVEVTGGVLWFQPMMATPTSRLFDGWTIGPRAGDVASAWDGKGAGRPDPDLHVYNELPRYQSRSAEGTFLPRSVRIELEFESAKERGKRPFLSEALEPNAVRFEVSNGATLPRADGSHVLIGGEWMQVVAVDGDYLTVQRGARATLPAPHVPGSVVHFGQPIVAEIPIPMYQDDW